MEQDASPEEGDAAKKAEDESEEQETDFTDPRIEIDGHDMTKGAKLTMTFQEGLVVQVLPNGDVVQ